MATSNIGNMGVTSYVYDGEGRRIEKTSSTFTSYYVYDSSGDPVAEYTTETQPVYGTLYVTPDLIDSTAILHSGFWRTLMRTCSFYAKIPPCV